MEKVPVIQLDESGTKRKLESRHLTMIAIAGTIGTGLFIKSGDVIANAGAIGALTAYILAGISVFSVVMSLGEMATMIPISGSFNEYAARFIDPALGFAGGWMYWLQWLLTFPAEIQAAAGFISHWVPTSQVSPWIWYFLMMTLLTFINLIAVNGFGEFEYWLSFIKIFAIVFFIITAAVIIARDHYGFSTWSDGGGAFLNGPVGIGGALVSAAFAFGGTELVGITAGEANNPGIAVPKAIKGTFWRIAIFYFLSIFLIGLILPASYLHEISGENGLNKSPFVFTLAHAGMAFAPDLINFVGLVAVTSAANSSIYACSRTMMAQCQAGRGPKFLSKTNSRGIPFYQAILVSILGLVVLTTTFIKVSDAEASAGHSPFDLLVNCIGACILMTWTIIAVTHIRFRAALKEQGIPLSDLIYVSPVGVYGDYLSIVINIVSLFFSGSADLFLGAQFNTLNFLDAYLILIIYPILFFAYKWYARSTIIPLSKVDLISGVQLKKNLDADKHEPQRLWRKIIGIIA
ncbi:hypothetical protein HDV06_000361 [Boothiomyces sp. JEL0866]|nr:hypothetical protein HDV06_000361 [Boothiomyces sp. JEL0866]